VRVLGLTGGVGAGKSACAALLAKRSIPVIDTDDLARQVVEPGEPGLTELSRRFGPGILDSEGRLRRDELARHVFSDVSTRKEVEDILHPRIRRLWQAKVDEWRAQGVSLAVVAIPLLFETNAQKSVDKTLCVACTRETQLKRLLARGWTVEESAGRIAAQMPMEQKMALADFVIWSEGPLDIHEAQLERLLASL
jgi:dephospho-CoA kinase